MNHTEKRMVKLYERREQYSKDMSVIEKMMVNRYGQDWRYKENAKSDDNYQLFFDLIELDYKTGKSIYRMEVKYNLDADKVMRKFRFDDPRVKGSGSF